MSTMERRKAEIAAKRAQVAELKRAREARASALSSAAPSRPESTQSASQSTRTTDVRNLVTSLLGEDSGSSKGDNNNPLSSSRGAGSAIGVNESGRTTPLSESAGVSGPWSERGTTPQVVPSDGYSNTLPSLSSASVELYELTPRPKIFYDKSVQTSDFPDHSTSTRDAIPSSAAGTNHSGGGVGSETAEEMRARIISELEAERVALDAEIEEEKRRAAQEQEEERAKGLSPPALNSLLSSTTFLDFLDRSSKVVQRAMSELYDPLTDYRITNGQEEKANDGANVRLLGSWYEDRWGKGRSVTGVEWSPKFPELFVASYNKKPLEVNEPDGIACVWNLHLAERPEYVFHAQSDVLSVAFSPFHHNLIVGGTYSGQILLWDNRSRHPNPVLKTPLSASGHTHPVYSLSMVGTQNAHNLVSASTDGTICAWTLDMLARPQEVLELLHPAHNKTDEVSVTALGFPEGETTTFWVGTEEGNVYAANRYDRAGAKAGLVQTEVYRGHSGPVTGMDFHPVAGTVDLSDMFLTCGVDWTVKLWRAGAGGPATSKGSTTGGAGGAGGGGGGGVMSPIFSFEEADDYVFDVKWHPHHPALFGSVDGAGKFALWNLNADTEVPIVSTSVAPNAPRGLNKLAWDRKDGRKAAIGSSDGKVYVYELSQDLTTPREGEWEQMRKTCSSARNNAGDLVGR